MSNEDIIKFINDNCRHCSDEGFDDIIDDCHNCPLLKERMATADMEEDNPMKKVLANLFDGIREDT